MIWKLFNKDKELNIYFISVLYDSQLRMKERGEPVKKTTNCPGERAGRWAENRTHWGRQAHHFPHKTESYKPGRQRWEHSNGRAEPSLCSFQMEAVYPLCQFNSSRKQIPPQWEAPEIHFKRRLETQRKVSRCGTQAGLTPAEGQMGGRKDAQAGGPPDWSAVLTKPGPPAGAPVNTCPCTNLPLGAHPAQAPRLCCKGFAGAPVSTPCSLQ